MSDWYPKAEHKNIRPGSNDPAIKVRGAILHVDAGNVRDLFGYFNGPSGGIESHFQIAKDGHVFQYRSLGREADANYKANSFVLNGVRWGYVSIETQGLEHGTWTQAQLRAIKQLLAWLSEQHDFPLRETPGPRSKGVGYHTLFGAPGPWTPVSKSCPGPARKRQFHNELVPWMREQRNPQPGDNDRDEGDDAPDTYRVKGGDTLTDIAERFGTEVEYLARRNDISNPNIITVGQVLHIPTGKGYQGNPPGSPSREPRLDALNPGVRRGRRHNQVKKLQRLLIKAGYGPIPDGITTYYGPQTSAAVARFHNRNPRFKSTGVSWDPNIGPQGFKHLQREAQ